MPENRGALVFVAEVVEKFLEVWMAGRIWNFELPSCRRRQPRALALEPPEADKIEPLSPGGEGARTHGREEERLRLL